ncbi:hypothetical protein F5B19DRAFT_501885 [Rostrohypoxylon terebratum]|nr:hypothetical protein F5B19DRAFT_501885 [Rostrohypoxylon terebratum]
MDQTRVQGAAKRGRDIEEKDQDTPTCKRRRSDKSSKEPPTQHKGRKRAIENTCDPSPKPSLKQRQISRPMIPETSGNAAADNIEPGNPIEFWRKEGRWPSYLFEPDMEHLLAQRRSSSILDRGKRANSASSTTPSDQRPREEKSAQYRDLRYETLLATKGSFMVKSKLDIASDSKILCGKLLEGEHTGPENSLFGDDLFDLTCQKIHNRNEARRLEILAESVNEGWNNSIPLTGTRPQPDYSVGFQREAFTEEQLQKLAPFIGEFLNGDLSFFMATYYMYFPFFACEVKCGAGGLDVADRQNAHSMTLAARGIVELFRLVKRENEVHRQILSFSVSHDHQLVRIYGYYPVINEKGTNYYRHPIYTFDFTTLDGRDKWTAYRFTKNVYDTWMPDHFKRICSAIDQLPSELDFNVPALSESTGLSRGLESHLALSKAGSVSLFVDKDD